jgi:hypothetical protein
MALTTSVLRDLESFRDFTGRQLFDMAKHQDLTIGRGEFVDCFANAMFHF